MLFSTRWRFRRALRLSNRFLGHACRAFLAILLSGLIVGSGAELADSGNLAEAVACGFLLSGALWGVGYAFSLVLTQSPDAQLYTLTPLTPRRFYLRNLRRFGGAWLGAVALFPLLGSLGVVASMIDGKAASGRELVFFTASMSLYWLCGAIPLYEMLTDRRHDAYPIFLPRQIPRRFLPYVISMAALFLLGSGWTAPALRSALHGLLSLGPVGDLILFCLSPVSGLLAAQMRDPGGMGVWLILAVCAGLLAWTSHGIVRAIFRPATTVQEDWFSRWTEQREAVEAYEHAMAVHYERREALWAQSLSSLARDAAPSPPEMLFGSTTPARELPAKIPRLEYETTLQPEAQVMRHRRHYWTPATVKGPWQARVLSLVARQYWTLLAAMGWAIWLPFAVTEKAGVKFAPGVLMVILLRCLNETEALRRTLDCGLALPLRWRGLLPQDYWLTLRKNILGDALAAGLMSHILGTGVLCAAMWLAILEIVRLLAHLLARLDAEAAGGQRALFLLAAPLLVVWALAELSIFVMMVIELAKGRHAGAPLRSLTEAMLLAAAATTGVLLAGIRVASRRTNGSFLRLWPERNKTRRSHMS